MKKIIMAFRVGIVLMGATIFCAGCGSKKDASDSVVSIDETKNIETTEGVTENVDVESKDEDISDDSDVLSLDSVLGNYLYNAGDEDCECVFELSEIANNYYLEYEGVYDYAGAELEILSEQKNEDGNTEYEVKIYPFSGFSFAGDYWGDGYVCTITEKQDGKITISSGQPFFDNEEIDLEKTENRSVHELTLEAKENTYCDEVIGEWFGISERDGELHEINLEFQKNGIFKAVSKVADFPPYIVVGNYDMENSSEETPGSIACELFAYGSEPYAWRVFYDEELKCPIVYEEYTCAEPFTYIEEYKSVTYSKVKEKQLSEFVLGPGKRAKDVAKAYKQYLSGNYGVTTKDLVGTWLYVADTPAGDPCIFQLEFGENDHLCYSQYTMTGNNWFQNFCYDGSIEVLGDNDDGTSNVEIMVSELDENGTETDSISGSYILQYTNNNGESITLSLADGNSLIDGFEKKPLTFDKTDETIHPGDYVIEPKDLDISLEEIKELERSIRDYVNTKATDKDRVSLKAGIDDCPYARMYVYKNSQVVFAYYFDSKNGDVDERYYFDDERMIEWIEGNGNDDSKRERYYASDSPLDSRWKEVEKQILEDAFFAY